MSNQGMSNQGRLLLVSAAVLLPMLLGKIVFAQEADSMSAQAELNNGPVVGIMDAQAAIKKKHAKWHAGETALSRLSRLEQQLRVGLGFSSIQASPVPLPNTKLPPNLDWRNYNGNNVTPPKDQKSCGSCWAFAMTGGLESYVLLTQRKSTSLSEQALLDCSGVGSCRGGTLNADFLHSTGLPPEADFPYLGRDLKLFGRAEWCRPHNSWRKDTYKVGGWGSVPADLASIKAALANYGPVPTAMIVHEDFMHYKSGVYSFTTGKKMGGHAVLLVGYNDEGQYFIVKNSWGTDWGENGFFRIAYSEVTSQVRFGLSTIAYRAQDSEFMASRHTILPQEESLSSAADRLGNLLVE